MEIDMRYLCVMVHLTAGVTQPGGGGPEVSTHHAEAVETGWIYLQYLHSIYSIYTVDI